MGGIFGGRRARRCGKGADVSFGLAHCLGANRTGPSLLEDMGRVPLRSLNRDQRVGGDLRRRALGVAHASPASGTRSSASSNCGPWLYEISARLREVPLSPGVDRQRAPGVRSSLRPMSACSGACGHRRPPPHGWLRTTADIDRRPSARRSMRRVVCALARSAAGISDPRAPARRRAVATLRVRRPANEQDGLPNRRAALRPSESSHREFHLRVMSTRGRLPTVGRVKGRNRRRRNRRRR